MAGKYTYVARARVEIGYGEVKKRVWGNARRWEHYDE